LKRKRKLGKDGGEEDDSFAKMIEKRDRNNKISSIVMGKYRVGARN